DKLAKKQAKKCLSKKTQKSIAILSKQYEKKHYEDSIYHSLEKYIDYYKIFEEIEINDPNLYEKFIQAIMQILHYTRIYKVENEAKFVKKYKRILSEIDISTNPNKYIINLLIKYSKYKFLPHLYKDKKSLLISIAKIEYYY
ncbi:16240_t:CDS:1, partial [Cetraspora pellucida]